MGNVLKILLCGILLFSCVPHQRKSKKPLQEKIPKVKKEEIKPHLKKPIVQAKKITVISQSIKKVPTIPIVLNERVKAYLYYYTHTSKGRSSLKKHFTLARYYKQMMEKILVKEGLPRELFYLVFIESGFDNHAYSPSHACGPWQFIATTAYQYGLKIDEWVDERKDPELATKAAAAYLKDLYNQFNDWYLAAAAYNAGHGIIQRLLKKYKAKDYWCLIKKAKEMKLETKNYVPKWLAIITIAKNPKKYGFNIESEIPWNYEKVTTTGLADLFTLAQDTGIKLSKLKMLNPALKRPFTPPYPYFLRVPKEKIEIVTAALQAQIETTEIFPHFYIYTVKSGDTLWEIAKKSRKYIHFIAKLNNLSPPYLLRPGQKLLIPYGEPRKRVYVEKDEKSGKLKIIYTVKSGDTLWDIARLFNVSINHLKKLNKIKGYLQPGDQLIIPIVTKIIIYKVKKGDTLWDIARPFKTTPKEIMLLNNLQSPLIHPGDKLKIKTM